MRFVDLFAGLGGFHLALKQLNHECVFACEIDPELQALYKKNYGIEVSGDIRRAHGDIPPHDILCAGFPCQSFSKASKQLGLSDPMRGDLFFEIIRVLKKHHPQYVLLENVSNLENHDNGKTWIKMEKALRKVGYDVKVAHFSPDEFGIPQIRNRMFIVASLSNLEEYKFPEKDNTPVSIYSILDNNPPITKHVPDHFISCLEVWQEFLDCFPHDLEFPSFPIWAMEFGATYPYESITPKAFGVDKLAKFRGSFGSTLKGISPDEVLQHLPNYAQSTEQAFPDWKIEFIRKNRELYQEQKQWIDKWLPQIQQFPHSLQKLEWNCKGEKRVLWENIIRFRPSGVRVKRPTTAPSLNTIDTQIPIIGWERRFMTMRECSRLHGMGDIELPEMITHATRALGNAVNVEIVKRIAQTLIPSQQTVFPDCLDLESSLAAD